MLNDELLNLAAKAGRIVLENGGEVFRVEETVERICKAYAKNGEVGAFVTPTVVMVSLAEPGEKSASAIQRIRKRNLNLRKVDEVNRISREVAQGKMNLREMKEALRKIEKQKELPILLRTIALGIAVAGFAVLFGGFLADAIAAFVVGCLVQLIRFATDKLGFNDYIINMISGMAAVLLGYGAARFGFGYMDTVVSAAIMLAVPGMLFTNALRDIVAGDLMSGSTRLVETLFIAIAIAAGSGLAFRLLYLLGLPGGVIG